MKKITAVLMLLILAASPVWAAPKDKDKGQSHKADAADRIGNETADALADVLTGENSKKPEKTGTMPPGLAKKDKTPAGWEKGNKEGWEKKQPEGEESPIRKFFRNLFQSK
ncbi:MAG TPA: hypothetical protein VD883_01675 [Candidatus Omnitrophota bacterium]|nr:hypothetical protein [Candidatus Omnitrophota bacterium]